MLPHGADEMRDLASCCSVTASTVVNGWRVDHWTLDQGNIDQIAVLYRATLVPNIGAEMEEIVLDNGITLSEVLIDRAHARDVITRSDATELAAAASFLGVDEWPEETLSMPNVPKMSRRKSDSGFDAMAVSLIDQFAVDDLVDGERLYIGSVKHSIQPGGRGVRLALVNSLGARELTQTYVGRQMLVLHGNLIREGMERRLADRLFNFLRNFPAPEFVSLHGAIVIDSSAVGAVSDDLANLPQLQSNESRSLRIINLPDLARLHERCA